VNPLFSQKKQTKKPDPSDTLKYKYLPTGIRIGTDIISLIKGRAVANFKGWEVNADADFYRYYLTIDYGKWQRDFILSNGDYQNNGNYYRIGTDVNFLLKDPDRNMFFLGFRYAHSDYSELLNYEYQDLSFSPPLTITKSLVSPSVKAHWFELTSGLRAKIWGPLWMGYTARIKFSPKVHGGSPDFNSFDIPGYGIAEKKNWWGLNYQIFYRIPIRKPISRKAN
jgi:Domain of unknown function (DUF6048)